ncbi:MAG: T9SS type A sorting domain-containing protein [Phaeodactylibacter sp.]|nr:T9SS type A sorting domain-containing protein [Phaeodactylibacter sp.]
MKKYLLMAPALFLCAFSFTQVEWAPTGTKYYYTYWWDDGISYNTDVIEVEVVGDTLIQGKNCRVFQQNSGIIGWNWGCAGSQYMYEEDGRAYFYNDANQSFGLLYDFTKTAGESWKVPVCGNEFCKGLDTLIVAVDSVTYTEQNGLQIRTQHVRLSSGPDGAALGNGKVYENIGSATRMYFVEGFCVTAEAGILNLRCFESPGAGIFNFVGEACDRINAVQEIALGNIQLLFYPNPAVGFLNFRLRGPQNLQGCVFRIVNAKGELVESFRTNQSETHYVQTVSNWASGLYFVQCMRNGKVIASGKFAVSR